MVPSNELAHQYMRWARSLFPTSTLPSLDPVIQCLVRGNEALTPEEELKRLKKTPPHILIGTPGRIKDILDMSAGSTLLGLDTLKTLVLDEADAVLQLPGRFPSHKQRWKHEVHKAPGLLVLNDIMKRRATFSGGEKHLSAGLENRPGKKRDERRPPEHVRRNVYQAAERSSANATDPNTGLTLPKPRGPGVHPLQLVATSATANSVMRHFFGARTGWLRTGAKDGGMTFALQVGRWIDLTGLSGKSMVDQGIRGLFGAKERSRAESLIETSLEQKPSTMPSSIEHTCIVVDEAPLSKQLSSVPLRNFEPKLARKKEGPIHTTGSESSSGLDDDLMIIKPEDEPQEHEMDQTLIEALAFSFASEGVERGLALIPARWSLLKTRASLEALGVTVRLASDVTSAASSATPELFLLQTTSSRGLDIPSLSHVFLVGYASVIDAVQYVHSAGRVARIGGDPDAPTTGKVVTLLRGLPHDTPLPSDAQSEGAPAAPKKALSTSEAKMANVFRRLGVVPKKFDLGLLTSRAVDAAATGAQLEKLESEQPETVVESSEGEKDKAENKVEEEQKEEPTQPSP
uniref:ATP-dependent RNA helicase n=2 Tax=Kalmanozyma brasiliensis (strain GHG001) TaxID=1365824 RepID=V5F3T0_KALBG